MLPVVNSYLYFLGIGRIATIVNNYYIFLYISFKRLYPDQNMIFSGIEGDYTCIIKYDYSVIGFTKQMEKYYFWYNGVFSPNNF